MSYFKNLWTDLVEKRLWPVALVLLLALVAVPVALGGSDDDAAVSAPVGATGAAGGAAPPAQVALDPGFPGRRDRGGAVRDPFKQRKVPPAATGTTSITAPPAGQSPTQAPPKGGRSAGGTPAAPTAPAGPNAPTAPAPPTAPKPPASDPLDPYVVSLVLGQTGAKRVRRTVERLTPLPSADNPFLIYLGVLSDKRTAVFLVSSDARASGEGACKPRKSSCQTVELQRGDTEYFAVTRANGEVTWYQLDLGRISRRQATSSRASAARRVSKRSPPKTRRRASAEDAFGSDRYTYDDATGLLRRVKDSVGGGHLPADDDDAPAAGSGVWLATEEPATLPELLPAP